MSSLSSLTLVASVVAEFSSLMRHYNTAAHKPNLGSFKVRSKVRPKSDLSSTLVRYEQLKIQPRSNASILYYDILRCFFWCFRTRPYQGGVRSITIMKSVSDRSHVINIVCIFGLISKIINFKILYSTYEDCDFVSKSSVLHISLKGERKI